MIQQYQKKPVAVEAARLTKEDAKVIAAWCGGQIVEEPKPSDHTDIALFLYIPTLEGTMRANENDFIIRGVKGEFYPCKPDIFEQTYELVH